MAHSKSAQKRVRASERRRLRNKAVRSMAKTDVPKAEKLIFAGGVEAAKEAGMVDKCSTLVGEVARMATKIILEERKSLEGKADQA